MAELLIKYGTELSAFTLGQLLRQQLTKTSTNFLFLEINMSRATFEADIITGQGWSQQEADDLRNTILKITALAEVHRRAKLEFDEAIQRWNGGVSAKVGTLPASHPIPNPTDLDGTSDIVKENLQSNLMAYAATVQALGSSGHLLNLIPLIGSVNLDVPEGG